MTERIENGFKLVLEVNRVESFYNLVCFTLGKLLGHLWDFFLIDSFIALQEQVLQDLVSWRKRLHPGFFSLAVGYIHSLSGGL